MLYGGRLYPISSVPTAGTRHADPWCTACVKATAFIAAVNQGLPCENAMWASVYLKCGSVEWESVCVRSGTSVFVFQYLQVPVHDAHLVQVVHCVQDLSDQRARILLRVETFFHDSVEQLATRNPAEEEEVCQQPQHHAHTHTGMHTWQ